MSPFPGSPTDAPENLMLSFNHYAYGAVIDWVYRHVAGIAPAAPGYRTIGFAPRPVAGLERAAAEVDTPYGRAAIAWVLEEAGLRVELDLPLGTTGRLDLPLGAQSRVTVDDGPLDDAPLGPGHHEILVTDPNIARPAPPNRNPRAVAALSARR